MRSWLAVLCVLGGCGFAIEPSGCGAFAHVGETVEIASNPSRELGPSGCTLTVVSGQAEIVSHDSGARFDVTPLQQGPIKMRLDCEGPNSHRRTEMCPLSADTTLPWDLTGTWIFAYDVAVTAGPECSDEMIVRELVLTHDTQTQEVTVTGWDNQGAQGRAFVVDGAVSFETQWIEDGGTTYSEHSLVIEGGYHLSGTESWSWFRQGTAPPSAATCVGTATIRADRDVSYD